MSIGKVTCKYCGCPIIERSLELLSIVPKKQFSFIENQPMKSLSNSFFINKGMVYKPKTKPIQLSSSMTQTDSPLQWLYFAQQEKFPFELPMCESCYHNKSNEMDREEANYTCSYCEILKMFDDLQELKGLEEDIKQEELKVQELEKSISSLEKEQTQLKEDKEFIVSLQDSFKEKYKEHAQLLAEIIRISNNSSDRFSRIDIQKEKEESKQYEENVWNKIHRIEWTENGILFNSINVVSDYQHKKYKNVSICFSLIIKECLLIRQMLRTQLTKCSIITAYSQFSMTRLNLSYLDFNQKSIKRTKSFTYSLQKLSLVVEELITIVSIQFNKYKPLYKISNFTANGLSLSPSTSHWNDAIKYFLSEFKHLREFVLKIVN
ncbi:hypothetical protein CL6EHI_121730 [Entamoeba histolytica]|nr:hypothetical protein CL6EHI_121730 [Entamoeba histolytica]